MDYYDFQDEQTLEAIHGGYDLHVHCAPDFFPRGFDDVELVKEMDRLGMSGAVLKSHHTQTATRAWLVNKYAGTWAKLYGAFVINTYTGGLSPEAVEVAIGLGIKFLWFPTKTAKNEQMFFPEEKRKPYIYILDEQGALLPEVHDILDLAKANEIVVGTGHMSTEESVALCKETRHLGITTVLTHPESPRIKHPMAVQKMLADLGVYIEEEWIINDECKPLKAYDVAALRPDEELNFNMNVTKAAQYIRELGVEHCYLSSDAALPDYPTSPASIYGFAKALIHEHGFTVDEVKTLTCRVPEAILGA